MSPYPSLRQVRSSYRRAAARTFVGATALALSIIPTGASARVTITPRFTYYFDNSSQRQSGTAISQAIGQAQIDSTNAELRAAFGSSAMFDVGGFDAATASNQIAFPLYGGSVSVDLDGAGRTQLIATALYGKGSATIRSVGTGTQTLRLFGFEAQDLLTIAQAGKARFKRLDLETTLQHRLNESFGLVGGFRVERIRERLDTETSLRSTANGANLINALLGDGSIDFGLTQDTGTGFSRSTGTTYSARLGGTGFLTFSERDQLYVNGLLHVSYTPGVKPVLNLALSSFGTSLQQGIRVRAETAIGPDLSVGYTHRLSDRIAADIRYRGVFYFTASGPRSFKDPRVNHGLNVGLSFSF